MPSDSLAQILRGYASRPKAQETQSLYRYVVESNPYLLAHHPPQDCFREHVWKIGGLYVCKGCAVTVSGIIAGAGLHFGTGWVGMLSTGQMAGAFVLMLLPTVVSSLLNLPRPLKHASRFILGILVASAFVGLFVTEHWWVRGVIVASFFLVKIPLERRRNHCNARDLEAHEPKKTPSKYKRKKRRK